MSSNPDGFGRFPGIATGATCPATHTIVIAFQSVTTLACAGVQPLAATAPSRAMKILGFMCSLLVVPSTFGEMFLPIPRHSGGSVVVGLGLESKEVACPVDESADDHAVVIDVPRIAALRAGEVDKGEFPIPKHEATGVAERRKALVGSDRSDNVTSLVHSAESGAGTRQVGVRDMLDLTWLAADEPGDALIADRRAYQDAPVVLNVEHPVTDSSHTAGWHFAESTVPQEEPTPLSKSHYIARVIQPVGNRKVRTRIR